MKTTTFKFNHYLSETKLMETLNSRKSFKVMVDAPTGGGKTNYIINFLKENDIPFVFLADTLLLMKQISETYDIPSYSSGNTSDKDAKQIVTVYNHIGKLYENKVVVIDEAHSLVSDYNYKQDVVETVLGYADLSNKVIMLSGTPLYTKDEFYKDVELFKCKKVNPKKYTVNQIHTDSREDSFVQTLTLAKQMRESGKTPVISMLETSKNLEYLIQLLNANGFNNVGMINSITKDGQADVDCTHYKSLVSTGKINADVIITTYVQGYNINNENCGLIFLPLGNRHGYTSIAQMVARFRNIEDLDIYMIHKVNDKGTFKGFNDMQETLYNNKKEEVNKLLIKINTQAKTSRAAKILLGLENENRYLINEERNIDEQMLGNRLLIDTSNILYSNIISANMILNQYNIKFEEMNTIAKDCIITEKQDKKEINYTSSIERFFDFKDNDIAMDSNILFKISNSYDELKAFNLSDNRIKEDLIRVFGNTKETNRLINSYSLRLSEGLAFKNIRKEIFTSIKVGGDYTSQEIFDIVQPIVDNNGGECNSKSKATEIVNCLFNTESTSKRIEGKKFRILTILNIL